MEQLHKLLLTRAWIIALLFMSCSDFVDIDEPNTELVRNAVFDNDGTANAAMVSVYVRTHNDYFASGSFQSDVAYIAGKSADEITADAGTDGVELYNNELLPTNIRVTSIWRGAYESLYQINAILEGLESSTGISEAAKRQLEGEAKFMRAFNYFYLVNLFGNVPLLTSTDYRINSTASRNDKDEVYRLILKDLTEAQELLPSDYSIWSNERIRPVKAAATALLARTYLYLEDWEMAELEATSIISNTALFSMVDVNSVFLKNNTEAIWQFYPPQSTISSQHGYTSVNSRSRITLTSFLLSAFEANDVRRAAWVGVRPTFSYVAKYKVGTTTTWTEYTTNLRLAEIYLIRAEARMQMDNIDGAKSDINVIRSRAGLPILATTSKEELLDALKQERRIEFFAEYGHRWMDLKRWGDVDEEMNAIKVNWQETDALYPIPQSERVRNKNLQQNPGYPN